jgi:hypothetical protein
LPHPFDTEQASKFAHLHPALSHIGLATKRKGSFINKSPVRWSKRQYIDAPANNLPEQKTTAHSLYGSRAKRWRFPKKMKRTAHGVYLLR